MGQPEARLFDVDLERFILGSLQDQGEQAFGRVANVISESDFSVDRHRTIFRAMTEIITDGEVLDRITLAHCLHRKGDSERVGGLTYLCDLDVGLPTVPNPEAYARRLRKKSQERRAYEVFDNLSTEAALGTGGTLELLQHGKDMIEQVAAMQIAQSAENLGDALAGLPGGIQELLRPPVGAVKIPFTQTQRRTAGMKPGEFWILGARPSMGKTALGLHLALDAAAAGHPVLFVSLEMSKESIGKRLLARMANVNLLDLIHGEITQNERMAVNLALGQLRRIPLYVFDRHCKSVPQIRTQIDAGCREGKYGLVIVDYLGLLEPGRHENRNIEVSAMSRGLKLAATECGLPILALHQLSRGLEGRADKRPELQDLRDSGSLEQDADVVMFLYREGYYKRDDPSLATACELLVRKARNGQIGKEQLEFFAQFGLFSMPLAPYGEHHAEERFRDHDD